MRSGRDAAGSRRPVAMAGQRISAQEILKDHAGEVAKLRKLGISEYAITTYVIRVQEGQSRTTALDALLQGRHSLTDEQKQQVRSVLNGLPG